jgi:hypothetical protein
MRNTLYEPLDDVRVIPAVSNLVKAINKVGKDYLELYPNPIKNNFFVELFGEGSHMQQDVAKAFCDLSEEEQTELSVLKFIKNMLCPSGVVESPILLERFLYRQLTSALNDHSPTYKEASKAVDVLLFGGQPYALALIYTINLIQDTPIKMQNLSSFNK